MPEASHQMGEPIQPLHWFITVQRAFAMGTQRCGTVQVRADTMAEAVKIAQPHFAAIPPLMNEEYAEEWLPALVREKHKQLSNVLS